MLLLGGAQIAVDAVADAGGGGLDGVAREMGVAGGGLNLRVAEQLADHRKASAQSQGSGCRGVAMVMDSNVVEPGQGADAAPRLQETGEMRTGVLGGM